MLRKIRIALAVIFFVGITLLLVGIGQQWWGWMAKLQFLPACLALNVAVIVAIALLTLVFGRIYCSVICPLGVWQDVVIWLRRELGKRQRTWYAKRAARAKAKGKPAPKNHFPHLIKHFAYKKEHKLLRYVVWAVFVLCIVLGLQVIVALIAPYSAYGRIVQSIVKPSGWAVPLVAIITFAGISYLAWTEGREWCNAVCPVGTTLSFFSRFSIFRIGIDASKCNECGRCHRGCKASCIDGVAKTLDHSRCIDCFDCIYRCQGHAISFKPFWSKPDKNNNKGQESPLQTSGSAGPLPSDDGPLPLTMPRVARSSEETPVPDPLDNNEAETTVGLAEHFPRSKDELSRSVDNIDEGKRAFMIGAILAGTAATLEAQNDGGLAEVIAKKAPKREQRLTPPGSKSARNFYNHCTACQLCVANCPNGVLRPSIDLGHMMQPKMDFDRGFCRPECTTCSHVCPAGAILPITPEEKTSIHIGRAVVDYDLCVVNTLGVNCGSCAAHCPAGAISMVRKNPDDSQSPRIPSVIEDRCIGCGKCEYLCPSRPFSAIHIEGLSTHIQD